MLPPTIRRLLPLLLAPAALAQTPTPSLTPSPIPSPIVAIPAPGTWYEAEANCTELGLRLYRVPQSRDDPVYDALSGQPGHSYWIARRRGGSCTCLVRDGSGEKMEEAPCLDLKPALCGT